MVRAIISFLVFTSSAAALGCSGGELGFAPLASGQRGVTSITTDGGYVYWTVMDGALRRVSIDGGPVETVVENITNPNHVTVDGTDVYWTMNQGVIARAPKAGGGTVELLAANETEPVGLRVDDTHVYWARRNGFVNRMPKASGQTATLSEDAGGISAITLAGTSLFWTLQNGSAGAVREVSITGGGPTTVQAAHRPDLIATNSGQACWADLDADAFAFDPQSTAKQISCVGFNGSDMRVVAGHLGNVDALVADDRQVYFSTTDGDVSVIPIGGGSPATFASGPPIGKTSIAVDLTSVYWAHSESDAIFALSNSMTVYP